MVIGVRLRDENDRITPIPNQGKTSWKSSLSERVGVREGGGTKIHGDVSRQDFTTKYLTHAAKLLANSEYSFFI